MGRLVRMARSSMLFGTDITTAEQELEEPPGPALAARVYRPQVNRGQGCYPSGRTSRTSVMKATSSKWGRTSPTPPSETPS